MLLEMKQLLHLNSDICTNTRIAGLCIAICCTGTINLKKNFFRYSQEKYRDDSSLSFFAVQQHKQGSDK